MPTDGVRGRSVRRVRRPRVPVLRVRVPPLLRLRVVVAMASGQPVTTASTHRRPARNDRDVLARAELTLRHDSDATITAPKARDIDEGTWAACAHGGDCRSPG